MRLLDIEVKKEVKKLLANDLKIIKDTELDIELLHRDNEKKCTENNEEITKLKEKIGKVEFIIEEELKASGEKKLECKLGYCSFREMPDKWQYMDAEIIDWCKAKGVPYFRTVEIVEKKKLKKAILSDELKLAEVSGITVTPQEPEFNYKIK